MIGRLLATEQRTAIERWCRERAIVAPLGTSKLSLVRVLGEHKMVVDLEDLSVAPHLALDGYWEIWNAIAIAKRVKPGWNAIDVGANFGYFSLLLSELVNRDGAGGQVEAWEPNPRAVDCLRKTLALNGGAFRLVSKGAGETAGQGCLIRRSHDFGGARLHNQDVAMKEHEVISVCDVERLDQTALGRVDFIKIDAEGYEPGIWSGMRGLLERKEPRAILMEWSPWLYEDASGFLQEIKGAGFRVGIVDGAGGMQPSVGDIASLGEESGHLDLWLERE